MTFIQLPTRVQHRSVVLPSLGESAMVMAANAPTEGALTGNKVGYIPFDVVFPFIVTHLGWYNGSSVGANIDVGIFDAAGNKIVSTGSTAQSGASAQQEVDVTDTVLMPGSYFAASVLSNSTNGVLRVAGTAATVGRPAGWLVQASTFPLPSTATFAAYDGAQIGVVSARTLSVL